MVVPLFVGREKSISALEEAMGEGRQGDLPLAPSARPRPTSRRPTTSSPSARSGTIIQLLRLPDGTVKVLVEGKRRARDPPLRRRPKASSSSRSRRCPSVDEQSVELEALMRAVHATFETYVKLNKRIPPEMLISVQTIDEPGAARRHHRRRSSRSSSTTSRRSSRSTSPSKRLEKLYELMQGGDRDPAGREEDPHARQEADGEDAEGVLPQRADAGDPEGAGRARRVQERAQRARGEDQEEEDDARRRRPRSRRS